MTTEAKIEELYIGDLVAISNVRVGELPDITTLASWIKMRGQLQPVLCCRVTDNIELLEKSIPEAQELLDGIKADASKSTPDQARVYEASISKQEGLLNSMKAELALLKAVKEPEEKYRIMDGHRRCAALKSIGVDSVRAIVNPPARSPIDNQIEQIALGVTAKNLTPYEEALSFAKLAHMGLRRSEIDQYVGGVTRDTIRQRINAEKVTRIAEKNATEEALAFLEACQNGEINSKNFNKIGQYHDREDLTKDEWDHAFKLCRELPYKEFEKTMNDMFGAKSAPSAREPRQVNAADEERVRMRSMRGVTRDLRFFETLLEKAKEKKVSKADQLVIEAQMAYAGYVAGNGAPMIPEALADLTKQVEDEIAKEEAEEKAAKSEAAKAARPKKSKEEAEHKREVRRATTAAYRTLNKTQGATIKAQERSLESLAKKVEKLQDQIKAGVVPGGERQGQPLTEADINSLNSKIATAEAEIEAGKENLVRLQNDYKAAEIALHAAKPDWLIEEEEAAEQRRIERENAKAAAAE